MQSGENGVSGGSATNPAVVEPEQELELVRARILEVADQIVSV